MDRINQILNHDLFEEYIRRNNQAEANRRFCRHNMEHFMDVARIGMLLNLEEGYGIDREMVYGAALLHDVGRFQQYLDKTPHEIASAQLAQEILQDSGFSDREAGIITEAIRSHRNAACQEEKNLNGLLYRADKMSRACYSCKAEPECNWNEEKKNRMIIW